MPFSWYLVSLFVFVDVFATRQPVWMHSVERFIHPTVLWHMERRLHGLVDRFLTGFDPSFLGWIFRWNTTSTTLNRSNDVDTEEDGDEEVVDDGLCTRRSVLDAWMDGA